MDNLTIGVLLPSSNIFPIAKEFEKGLKQGLKPLTNEGIEFEIVKEFVGNGEPKITEIACNKLLNFDGAAVVTGIVSERTIAKIAQTFLQKKVPLLPNNLGGYIPHTDMYNDYIALNSMHLWRHAWALGDWGVKKFGPKGMFVGAAYDAGYSFSHMFYEGMMAEGKNSSWSFSVPPFNQDTRLSQMEIIFPFIEQYQPDFIFAGFCGSETTMFLNEFIDRGWHNKIKVLGLPYLLSPVKPLNDDMTIYTTQPFGNAPEIFAESAFHHLGYQTGQTIVSAAEQAKTQDEFTELLMLADDLFVVNRPYKYANAEISLLKNELAAGSADFSSVKIDTTGAINIDADLLRPLTPTPAPGWFNPYLCL